MCENEERRKNNKYDKLIYAKKAMTTS